MIGTILRLVCSGLLRLGRRAPMFSLCEPASPLAGHASLDYVVAGLGIDAISCPVWIAALVVCVTHNEYYLFRRGARLHAFVLARRAEAAL